MPGLLPGLRLDDWRDARPAALGNRPSALTLLRRCGPSPCRDRTVPARGTHDLGASGVIRPRWTRPRVRCAHPGYTFGPPSAEGERIGSLRGWRRLLPRPAYRRLRDARPAALQTALSPQNLPPLRACPRPRQGQGAQGKREPVARKHPLHPPPGGNRTLARHTEGETDTPQDCDRYHPRERFPIRRVQVCRGRAVIDGGGPRLPTPHDPFQRPAR